MSLISEAEAEARREAEARAEAAMADLLAEEERNAGRAEGKRRESRKARAQPSKGKARAKDEGEKPKARLSGPPTRRPSPAKREAAAAAATSATAAADEQLRRAMLDSYDALAASIQQHCSVASAAALAEARTVLERLGTRRKKESQKQRKVHAGAMAALDQLQAATDASNLRAAVHTAEGYQGAVPALDEKLLSSRERLESMTLSGEGAHSLGRDDGPAAV
eukprot:2645377-Prymnesium_polylepis.1